MSQFGEFAGIVATAGSLSAAAGAISLAFLKRAKRQPPEEAVPAAVSRVSALIAMVFIALIYVFGAKIGLVPLGVITLACLLLALWSLITAVQTNTTYSFFYPERAEANRKLGGDTLTDEASTIKEQKGCSEQLMFLDAQGDKDLVWTRESQSRVQVKSTLSFIGLIAFGTCALASASMLVALFV
jgi:hypothetical protein